MPVPNTPALLALWNRAYASEFGLELTVTDQDLIAQDLHIVRRESGDPRFDTMQVTRMKDGTVWLVKKELNLEDETSRPLP